MRRSAFALIALFVAACATVPVQPPAAPQRAAARFKILQLNDVYKIEGLEGGLSGGLARVRTLREHLASDGTPVLVLHGGDALYPSVMSKYLDAKPMVDVMNLLDGGAGFDPHLIVTLGNHEFDKSTADVLFARLQESQFRWLGTNAWRCNPVCDQPLPVVNRTLVIDAGGTKIGLLGLLYPLKKSYAQTTDVKAAARDAVSALKTGGADVIIAVTHQDMPDDVSLVEDVAGIDLVIGGHDHLFMQQQVGQTWITKADADAKSVIVYDITVTPDRKLRTTPLRVTLDTTIAKDAMIDAAVQRWMNTLREKLGGNETLGQTEHLLEGVEPAVRGRETALGNLLADAARAQMKADVAIVNGGSIRINDNIPPGPITGYDMEGIFYYTNTLVAFTATGQQLLDMLRNSVSRVDAGDGRFLQVSGLRYAYRSAGDGGKYDVSASDVTVGGKPLDVSAKYTVATLDYVYLNGTEDGYELFSDANRPPKVNTELEADFRKTVEAYIRKSGTVETEIEGRIIRK